MTPSDDQHDDQLDRELQARLAAADPAHTLRPADPDRVARLLEATMSEPVSTTATGPRRGSRLVPALAAAAAAVVLLGVGIAVAHPFGDDQSLPLARETTSPAPVASSDPVTTSAPLVLGAPGVQGKCMVPSAAFLATKDVAFGGTVTDVTGSTVTLEVTRAYRGVDTTTVEVQAAKPAMTELVQAVDFQVGQDYLVSAADGVISVCGFSGPATPDLTALFDEAFAG